MVARGDHMDQTSIFMTRSSQSDSSPAPAKTGWWFSRDELIGFNWGAVIGYDFKAVGKTGYETATLYVYLGSGILRVNGTEAEALVEELKGRAKAL